MSDGSPNDPVDSQADPEITPKASVAPQTHTEIGAFRVFTCLLPTVIAVACVTHSNLFSVLSRISQMSPFVLLVGVGALASCAWIDSLLALPCRLGKRSRSHHTLYFILTQIFLVMPVLVLALTFAHCVANPW